MDFFRKKRAEKSAAPSSKPSPPQSHLDPANDPDMIKVYDEYGRELFVSKQEWRDNILPGAIKKEWNDADRLYGVIVGALQDGFGDVVVQPAEHLQQIDTTPSRAATILGIVYMETGRLDDAERVFEDHMRAHGEDGVLLTNLAKVHSRRGDEQHAEATLWHALELDPNQDNGLAWYAAINRERGGGQAAEEAFRRVAGLPGSWRARLWLAREALGRGDVASAEALYDEAFALAGRPVPADMLMQVSGDLGNAGRLGDVVRLCEPHFDPAMHGLMVGNNLIKAHFDLEEYADARRVLAGLFAQQRPDWQEQLGFWDTELAKAHVAERRGDAETPTSVVLAAIEGPIWTRHGSPFASLLPVKRADAPRIAVLGSSARTSDQPSRPTVQLPDAPGRMSRAVPLLLAEQIHLRTDAVGIALIPFAKGHGFALFSAPQDDHGVCQVVAGVCSPPSLAVSVDLDASGAVWRLHLRLLRPADESRLAESTVEGSLDRLGASVSRLVSEALQSLVSQAGVRPVPAPGWYETPDGADYADYMMRLEQQLAVGAQGLGYFEGDGLSGERSLLDGTIRLCLRQPSNLTIRMVLAQTLRLMSEVRPDVLAEFENKVTLLQRQHPLPGDAGALIDTTMHDLRGVSPW